MILNKILWNLLRYHLPFGLPFGRDHYVVLAQSATPQCVAAYGANCERGNNEAGAALSLAPACVLPLFFRACCFLLISPQSSFRRAHRCRAALALPCAGLACRSTLRHIVLMQYQSPQHQSIPSHDF